MDIAHRETDQIIAKVEKQIAKEYKKAHKEVSKKLDDYLATFATKDEKWREWVASGKETQEAYEEWKKGQIIVGKRWEAMKNTLAADYANAALIAESIVNGHKPDVYALNHNYATFEVEKGSMMDTSYTLYSREAVERMYRENPRLYHQPGDKIKQAIRMGKQAAWDKRRIQSVLTQGILQGESIPKLTKRLEKVTDGDHNAAIRNARTMMTGVQNAGRIDAYARANAMGIPVQKQWLATLDSRTRHWHRQLDGQTANYDEPFVHSVPGNPSAKIMFPGDPTAMPVDLYNCRCTLIASIKGFERDLSNTDIRYNENLKDMDYETWKATKKSTSNPITRQEEIGKNIRQGWWNRYAGHGGAKAPTRHKYTAKDGQRIIDDELNNQVQRELDELNSIEYPDIWQNKVVTPADYPDMEKQIATKSRYLDRKIHESKVKNDTKALSKYQSQKESLLDFEKKGKRHQELTAQLHPEKAVKEKTKPVIKPEPVKPITDQVNKGKEVAAKSVEKEIGELREKTYDFSDISPKLKKIKSVEDYERFESRIEQRIDYYKDIVKRHGDNDADWAKRAVKDAKEKLKKLEEFEKDGKRYRQLKHSKPDIDIKPKTKPVKEIEKTKPLDNNDTSGNINKTRFKRNGEPLDKDYEDALRKKFDEGTDLAKKVYDKHIPDGGAVVDLHNKGTAYQKQGSVFLDQEKDLNNKRGKGTTWFHEHGHYIDFKHGYKSTKSKDFKKAIKKDVENYEKMMKEMMEKKTGVPMFIGDVRREISREMRRDGECITSGIQDIFGGVIKKPYPGARFSHSQEYWERFGDRGVPLEAFAHFYDASFDEKKRKLMKKYLPNAWNEFEKLLAEMV